MVVILGDETYDETKKKVSTEYGIEKDNGLRSGKQPWNHFKYGDDLRVGNHGRLWNFRLCVTDNDYGHTMTFPSSMTILKAQKVLWQRCDHERRQGWICQEEEDEGKVVLRRSIEPHSWICRRPRCHEHEVEGRREESPFQYKQSVQHTTRTERRLESP